MDGRTCTDAIRVPVKANTNAEAAPMRSWVAMFLICVTGPTRKQVPTNAVMLPSVNMKMKLELQSQWTLQVTKSYIQIFPIALDHGSGLRGVPQTLELPLQYHVSRIFLHTAR